MKKISTLIIAGLMAVSHTGQTVKSTADGQQSPEQLKRTEHFTSHNMERIHGISQLPVYHKIPDNHLKSSRDIKQKLDSLVYQEYIEETGLWLNQGKGAYSYYANGKLKDQSEFTWIVNNNTGIWRGMNKYEFEYDNNEDIILHKNYGWDFDTGQWYMNWKIEYSYDNNRNMIQWLYSNWNDETSQWDQAYKIEYTYDGNNHRIRETGYQWNDITSQWINDNKTEYTYDNDGNQTLEITYDWDEEQWIYDHKNEFTYDNEGFLTMVTGSSHWQTDEWVYEYKEEFAYDESGNFIMEIDYEWDNQWIEANKQEYVFAGNGDLLEEHFYSWNTGTRAWQELYKEDHAYNNSYTYNDLILPVIYNEWYYFYQTLWWEINYNHMRLTTIRSHPDGKGWNEKYKTTYSYSELDVTGIPHNQDNNFSIYPNPAVSVVTLQSPVSSRQSATVELFDLNGRKLLEKQIAKGSEEITMDVRNLQSGVYFCRLTVDNRSITKKLIVQK